MATQNSPARLHVLFARENSLALVIRRGPSKTVCTCSWDRENDSFKLGQWMRGRIYERRCDLSPDGEHFIYFAMNGRWNSQTRGSWTAISRAPYLKALTLFSKGDCWNGGGLFLSAEKYWLNGCGYTEVQASAALRRNLDYRPPGQYGGECPGVYYNRLQRDGWVLTSKEHHGAVLFKKALPGSWSLRKLAFAEIGAPPGRGCYWDAHELYREPDGHRLAFPDWDWAEWDRSRLVWATAGQLRTAQLGDDGLHHERLLRDFNGMRFEPIAAPY